MNQSPIIIEERDGVTFAQIYGPIDSATSPAIAKALQSLPGTGPIVVDLRKALYVNSKGVGVLSQAYVWAKEAGRPYGFLLEEGPVNETMQLVGVLELIPAAPTEELLMAELGKLTREEREDREAA